jgi:hypothetical protein
VILFYVNCIYLKIILFGLITVQKIAMFDRSSSSGGRDRLIVQVATTDAKQVGMDRERQGNCS